MALLRHSLLGVPPTFHEENYNVEGACACWPSRSRFTTLICLSQLADVMGQEPLDLSQTQPRWKIEQGRVVILRHFATIFYVHFINPNAVLVEYDNGRLFREIAAYVKLLATHRQTRKAFYVEQWIPKEKFLENHEDPNFVNGKEVASKLLVDHTIQNDHTDNLVALLNQVVEDNPFAKSLCRTLRAATFQESHTWLDARDWEDEGSERAEAHLPVVTEPQLVHYVCLGQSIGSSHHLGKASRISQRN